MGKLYRADLTLCKGRGGPDRDSEGAKQQPSPLLEGLQASLVSRVANYLSGFPLDIVHGSVQ